jgi:cellobiose phosphorylase
MTTQGTPLRTWTLPRAPAGMHYLASGSGIRAGILPNGALFALEHCVGDHAILINQLLGSPVAGGVARLLVRSGGPNPSSFEAFGPHAAVELCANATRAGWRGRTAGIAHCLTLALHPDQPAWMWHVELRNAGDVPVDLDAILIQDIGLGPRGFLSNSEAYASQYIDHHVADAPDLGPVLLCRQNLAQDGRHPWVLHACLEGARAYATDGLQLFGPHHRELGTFEFPYGSPLPSVRLQHEMACVALQSQVLSLVPGARAAVRFVGLFLADHPLASGDADVQRLHAVTWQQVDAPDGPWAPAVRGLPQISARAPGITLSDAALVNRYRDRLHPEHRDGACLSLFTPDGPHNRHVVLRAKERVVARRHGALLRTSQALLPDDGTLCLTAWMHGVFAAQLTLGNTSLHKVLSVSRDPYDVTPGSGLRILVEAGRGWQLLSVPSIFEMGLSDCRWIYRLEDRAITVSLACSGTDPAVQWRVSVDGAPCRFLIFAHLVLGERELEQEPSVTVDERGCRFTLRPDAGSLWGQRYPDAVFHLVVSTPDAIEALGGDELLYEDGRTRNGPYVALRTRPAAELRFAVVGSLVDAAAAARLAERHAARVDDAAMLAPAAQWWRSVTRALRVTGDHDDARALDTALPWLVHDAIIHLSVPHGLEQHTGAAWGTRDVCQGPVELLLALEHDHPVRDILRSVFAQQYQRRGDWPQWFMHPPYAFIRDPHPHGDVIVWPLKALNDYLEASGDLAFLDEPVGWWDDSGVERTPRTDSVSTHVEKLLATVTERCIPGTHLIRYGHGDWNDSLQPADPAMRDWMVSSWTVALLYQQVRRYAEVVRRRGDVPRAARLDELALAMQRDFNRHLLRDGTVAGYALFREDGGTPELLIHPCDTRTGLRYSLLPMTRSIIGGLFTSEQAQHHLHLIRQHLLLPDGAHLLDRPLTYRGGVERTFRRAESAAFLGREIGLMYVHSHLRYGEAMAVLGDAAALWEALQVVNPITVTERLPHASLRQRNAYFSSSDAAFVDRYQASAQWEKVRTGSVPVDGGWRVYSSGPGIYLHLLICEALGRRRRWGERVDEPRLPEALRGVALQWGSNR